MRGRLIVVEFHKAFGEGKASVSGDIAPAALRELLDSIRPTDPPPVEAGYGWPSVATYHVGVSKLENEGAHQARRAAIRSQLLTGGRMEPDVAERWCDAWEAEAALRGLARDSDYWDAGKLWIDRQCAVNKRPPN